MPALVYSCPKRGAIMIAEIIVLAAGNRFGSRIITERRFGRRQSVPRSYRVSSPQKWPLVGPAPHDLDDAASRYCVYGRRQGIEGIEKVAFRWPGPPEIDPYFVVAAGLLDLPGFGGTPGVHWIVQVENNLPSQRPIPRFHGLIEGITNLHHGL